MGRFLYLPCLYAFCAVLAFAAPGFSEDQPKNPAPVPPAAPAAPAVAKPKQPLAPSTAPAQPHKPTPKEEADSLLGKEVFGANGAQMGLVTNVLVDREGHPIALVIDFGGFLGVGSRKIAVDWHLMQFHPGDAKKPVTLSLDKDQLTAAPEYKSDKPARIMGAPKPVAKPATPAAPTKPTEPSDGNGTK